jgi:hypothetical protein
MPFISATTFLFALTPENQKTFFLYASFLECFGDFSACSVCLENAVQDDGNLVSENLKPPSNKTPHSPW